MDEADEKIEGAETGGTPGSPEGVEPGETADAPRALVTVRVDSDRKRRIVDPAGLALRPGDRVILDTETGLDMGTVVAMGLSEGSDLSIPPRRVVRKATDDDLRRIEENAGLEREGRKFCMERIDARGLQMRLVATSVTLDKKKFVFYFTSEKRVDFRELVKDLASRFRTRIELRQIGIRDEAKMVGGLGNCGREVCCRLFLTQFEPISIRMAKGQDLSLNPTKISGLCGRLMCCLSYEYEGKKKKPVEAEPGERETKGVDAEKPGTVADRDSAPAGAEPLEPPYAAGAADSRPGPSSGQTGPASPGHDKDRRKRRRGGGGPNRPHPRQGNATSLKPAGHDETKKDPGTGNKPEENS